MALVSNKSHKMLSKLSDHLLSFCNTREEITVLNRLHIGHTYLTRSFSLRKEEIPVCVACNAVIECADLLEFTKKYFEERSLYSLFWNVYPEIMFSFLREIGAFYKICSVLKICFV